MAGVGMRLRTDGVTWREIDGEMVILDLATSTYLTTNRSGTVLVRELTQDRSEDELVAMLVDEFDISAELARADVREFIGMLRKSGLLLDSRLSES